MHVVAFNGSPRKNGNTHKMLSRMLERCEAQGISTELVSMGAVGYTCRSCGLCRKNQVERCFQAEDPHVNEWFSKLLESDGIILGSPVYGGWLTPVMKGFIEKAVFMARGPIKRGERYTILRNKVGVAVTSTRRSGGIQTLQSMIALFAHTQMIMPCAGEWPIASFGSMAPDAFEKDEKGIAIIDAVADRLIEALFRLRGNQTKG